MLTTVATEFKKSYACWFAKEWRQSTIDQWTVLSNWSRNQIKVDQGEFDPFVDIYLETDQNDPKINQNDPMDQNKVSRKSTHVFDPDLLRVW